MDADQTVEQSSQSFVFASPLTQAYEESLQSFVFSSQHSQADEPPVAAGPDVDADRTVEKSVQSFEFGSAHSEALQPASVRLRCSLCAVQQRDRRALDTNGEYLVLERELDGHVFPDLLVCVFSEQLPKAEAACAELPQLLDFWLWKRDCPQFTCRAKTPNRLTSTTGSSFRFLYRFYVPFSWEPKGQLRSSCFELVSHSTVAPIGKRSGQRPQRASKRPQRTSERPQYDIKHEPPGLPAVELDPAKRRMPEQRTSSAKRRKRIS